MGEQTYTLEELARAVGMSPRNVRSYATKQLIDKPGRQGRAAVYDDRHRAQLEWVRAQHEAEGLPLPVIRRLIERGERPGVPAAPASVDVSDTAMSRWGEAAHRPGGIDLHTSVFVRLAADHADTARVLRGAHRVADALGYVHFEDLVRTSGPFHRLARFRRAVTEREAAALAGPNPPGAVVAALDELRSTVRTVPAAVLLVGGWLVAHTPEATRTARLDPRQVADVLASGLVLSSPDRAAALVASIGAARV